MKTTRPRARRRWLCAGLMASALAGCAAPKYGESPFLCGGMPACPPGYACRSDLCVRVGAPLPPLLLARSASPIEPVSFADPDRRGVLTCWTSREDQNVQGGGVHGTFLGPSGDPLPPVTFASFDTRGRSFLATCAPIPRSDGKVLVAVWLQSSDASFADAGYRPGTGVTQLQLLVWTPDRPNGTTGTSRAFYAETSPDNALVPSHDLRVDVVGDQVRVPYVWSLGEDPTEPGHGISVTIGTLTVDAAAVAAGAPVRRSLIDATEAVYNDTSVMLKAGDHGVWILTGYQLSTLDYFGAFASRLMPAGLLTGFGIPLTTKPMTVSGTMVDQLAALWSDPVDNGAMSSYRVAWLTPRNRLAFYGPRLPFRRVDTPSPAALRVGDDFYLFGSPVGTPLDTVPVDGGAPGQGVNPPGDGGLMGPIAFNVYKIPWGADSATPMRPAGVIEPRAASAQVTAASVAPMPGASGVVGLTWVEFYPPDQGGHGARYAIYAKQYVLP